MAFSIDQILNLSLSIRITEIFIYKYNWEEFLSGCIFALTPMTITVMTWYSTWAIILYFNLGIIGDRLLIRKEIIIGASLWQKAKKVLLVWGWDHS